MPTHDAPADAARAAVAPTGPDQSRSYGRQFAAVYDQLFPALPDTDQAVRFLRRLVPGEDRSALELGVGTGRVAVPLARSGLRVTGVDSSPAMLARARNNALRARVAVELVEADIRTWVCPAPVDLVLCVCATLSMLASRQEQLAVLDQAAAAAARPGAVVVLETHSPDRIRRLHAVEGPVARFTTEVPGLPGGVHTVAELAADGVRWDVRHEWHDGGTVRSGHEFSLLTGPADLEPLAARAGLAPCASTLRWDGRPADPLDPTYVSVFQRPRTPAEPRRRQQPPGHPDRADPAAEE